MDGIDQDYIHECYYSEKSDSLILATESCKLLVIKNVFQDPEISTPGEPRKLWVYNIEGIRWVWDITELQNNKIAIPVKSSEYMYLQIDLETMAISKTIVKQQEDQAISLSPYFIQEIQPGNHFILMDDELINYDPVNCKINNFTQYSGCNYFELHSVNKHDLFCYVREDRRGMFILRENSENKKLEVASKFHLDSIFVKSEGLLNNQTRIDHLHKIHYLQK